MTADWSRQDAITLFLVDTYYLRRYQRIIAKCQLTASLAEWFHGLLLMRKLELDSQAYGKYILDETCMFIYQFIAVGSYIFLKYKSEKLCRN